MITGMFKEHYRRRRLNNKKGAGEGGGRQPEIIAQGIIRLYICWYVKKPKFGNIGWVIFNTIPKRSLVDETRLYKWFMYTRSLFEAEILTDLGTKRKCYR